MAARLGVCLFTSCSGEDRTALQGVADVARTEVAEPGSEIPSDSGVAPAASNTGSASVGSGSLPGTPTLAPFESRCGNGTPTEAGQRELRRRPYVQNVTEHSMSVLYKLRQQAPDEETLVVSTPVGAVVAAAPAARDPSASDGLQRVARVTGLEPSTYYCYSVGSLTGRIGFRTAPPHDVDAVVRFAVFGDSGGRGAAQLAVRDQLATVPFDLLLHTGDIAYEVGSLEQFEEGFFDVYAELLKSISVFPVPGNHEYVSAAAAPFLEVFDLPGNDFPEGDLPDGGLLQGRAITVDDERWYSFDWGDVHFVGLDTEQPYAEQIAWLDRDLAQNERSWAVVYLHRPPYSSGAHGGSPTIEAAFVPLFERHRVTIVFAGHDHDYERTVPINGVTYVITGGGGKSTRSVGSSWFTAHSERALHFVSVEVSGGTLMLRAIDSTGRELDSAVITR
jgi:acid phosphatase type 7